MEIYKTYLFSVEIYLLFFFYLLYFQCYRTSHYMDIRYVTLRYTNTIHYCTKLLFFFMRRNVYSSQWEARAEWFQQTQDDDDDCKMGQQGLPKFRFLSHTYCWLHRNAVPKNILFVIWNLVSRKRRTTLAASFTNQEV